MSFCCDEEAVAVDSFKGLFHIQDCLIASSGQNQGFKLRIQFLEKPDPESVITKYLVHGTENHNTEKTRFGNHSALFNRESNLLFVGFLECSTINSDIPYRVHVRAFQISTLKDSIISEFGTSILIGSLSNSNLDVNNAQLESSLFGVIWIHKQRRTFAVSCPFSKSPHFFVHCCYKNTFIHLAGNQKLIQGLYHLPVHGYLLPVQCETGTVGLSYCTQDARPASPALKYTISKVSIKL